MKASVVVPAYNAENTIGKCLDSLARQSISRSEYEIIVVDDGSTDATPEIVARYEVRLIRQPNRGPAAARNAGAQVARGELLLFTDADCEPAPDWIEMLCGAFTDPSVAGAKGTYRTHQHGLVPRFVQVEYEEKYELMKRWKWIDFVDTYSAAYRCDLFLTHGGFDTRFPSASVEDQEFSFRLAERGHRLIFVPRAIVYHQHPPSLASYARRKYFIGYWKMFLLLRHPSKAVTDSHTPQILKIQVALIGLLALSLLATLADGVFWWAAASLAMLLLLSTLSFCLHAVRRDRSVALVAPFLLLVRAASLTVGLVVGCLALLVGYRLKP